MKEQSICKNCNKQFYKQNWEITKNNFCCRSCSTSFNNRVPKRKKKTNICISCKKTFIPNHRSNNHCSSCRKLNSVEIKMLTIEECQSRLSIIGKHPSYKNSIIRQHCRIWNKHLLNTPCILCGYTLHTELHHKKPISSFPLDTPLNVVNDTSNIMVLCPNCHWEEQHKEK
jgi:hypothetical protein